MSNSAATIAATTIQPAILCLVAPSCAMAAVSNSRGRPPRCSKAPINRKPITAGQSTMAATMMSSIDAGQRGYLNP
jgi:hypothetical protein